MGRIESTSVPSTRPVTSAKRSSRLAASVSTMRKNIAGSSVESLPMEYATCTTSCGFKLRMAAIALWASWAWFTNPVGTCTKPLSRVQSRLPSRAMPQCRGGCHTPRPRLVAHTNLSSLMASPAPLRSASRISEYLRESSTPGAPARNAANTASFTACGVLLL
jgi:hypothetical protein